jgi:hypothetical protein
MVNDMFPDTAKMIAARNAQMQALIAQNRAQENINAAREEAIRRSQRGAFTTVPTNTGQQMIGRQNHIGCN